MISLGKNLKQDVNCFTEILIFDRESNGIGQSMQTTPLSEILLDLGTEQNGNENRKTWKERK